MKLVNFVVYSGGRADLGGWLKEMSLGQKKKILTKMKCRRKNS